MLLTNKIKELYKRFPQAKKEFNEENLCSKYSFENSLKELESIDNFDYENLENFCDSYALYKLIMPLPFDAVIEKLGEKIILFAFLRNSSDYKLNQKFKDATKIDPDMLNKSKRISEKNLGHKNIPLILRNYQLFEKTVQEIKNLPLEELLIKNSVQNFNWNQTRLGNYSFEVLTTDSVQDSGYANKWGCWYSNDESIQIFLDAPVGICLMFKEKPNAFITFYAKDNETIFIPQIQGVRPIKIYAEGISGRRKSSRGLAVLDWRKILVERVKGMGKMLDFKTLEIQSGYCNHWTIVDYHGNVKLPLSRALQVYDKEAERMGFTQKQDRNWSRPIA